MSVCFNKYLIRKNIRYIIQKTGRLKSSLVNVVEISELIIIVNEAE